MQKPILFDENLYFVKDLYEGAFLYASGLQLIKLVKQGKDYFFGFSPKNECEYLRNEYWALSPQTLVKPKQYADSVKSLKERIFSNPY